MAKHRKKAPKNRFKPPKSESKTPSEGRGSGGGASSPGFTDRSGKVHTFKERGAAPSVSNERSFSRKSEPQSEARKPKPRSEPSFTDRYEQKFENDRPRHGKRKEKLKKQRHHRKSEHGGRIGRGRGRPERAENRAHGGAGKNSTLKLSATVDKTKSGAGFLIFDKKAEYEDLYLPPRHASELFHGDRVRITIDSRGSLIDLKVLNHRFRELVGKYSPNYGKRADAGSGYLIYESRKFNEQVYLPKAPANAKAGDYLRVKVIYDPEGEHPLSGEVLEVFGDKIPASHDIPMVAAEFGLIEKHTEAAEREALAMKLEIPGKDLEGRTDLRSVPFITIDGETARDFDDAVHVERAGDKYKLWVAIADVSHYVKEGSAIDVDAYARATSVYFPERAFHMLPSALSENLCSLRPREPRLSMACSILIDRNGNFLETELFNAVIESRRRATYEEIEKEKIGNEGREGWEYAPHFELYRILLKTRIDRGSIDFELPEFETRVDKDGEPTSIQRRTRFDAHRLIESFMIAANEAVTVWARARQMPFVYRVHDVPSPEAMQRFANIAKSVGFHFVPPEDEPTPMDYAEIARSLSGHPAETLLNQMLLRSMRQAIYSADHGGHFGLASHSYTHFTSPIRRYPDLIVHRMLRLALGIDQGRHAKLSADEKDAIYEKLTEQCEHSSYRERLAAEAEREVIRIKQVRMMMKHLGEDFEGSVGGMNDRGLYVQLKDPFVEGFVPKELMEDDFYEFREDRMAFVGKRKRKTYRVGDPVRAQVVRADLDRRQIELKLVDSIQTNQEGEADGTDSDHSTARASRKERSTA